MDTDGKYDIHEYSSNRTFSHRSRSVSISIPESSNELNSGEISLVPITDGPLHTTNYNKAELTPRVLRGFDHHNDGVVHGIMNPHAKVVKQMDQFVVGSCVLAIFIDPLFFYLLSVKNEYKCIVLNWPLAITLVVSRSITDLIYFLRMLVQFRIAFISPESSTVGVGELVDNPRKIALRYMSSRIFFVDLFLVVPIPQIIALCVPRDAIASSRANYAKFLLQSAFLVQYIPRLYRFLPLLVGQSPSGFIFESGWANFVINLLTFILAGHVVGSGWYVLGLQRVNKCLRDACQNSTIADSMKFIDCGRGNDFGAFERNQEWNVWKQNKNSSDCFSEDGFAYGIYVKAVNLTTEDSLITRYVYSLFWGFQQISTLAGNQSPSYFVWEVIFTMCIIGLGLLLFALLIGNMQNFLQGLGRRRLENYLRRRDIKQWMKHRLLPEEIRSKVRMSERHNWAATGGVNEEMLIESFPEDLQRDIRCHLFKFVKKAQIFVPLDEPVLDAICERLRKKTYIKEGTMLYEGGAVTKMIFIVKGKMESIGNDGNKILLTEGGVCGEELFEWCFEHSSINRDARNQRKQGRRLLSNRTVKCIENVEAFVLRAADLAEVFTIFAGFLKNHRGQFAKRYKSPYWQDLEAWRCRKKRQSRACKKPQAICSSKEYCNTLYTLAE